MKARQLIEDASCGPEAMKANGQTFDEAWTEIARNFGNFLKDIEKARKRLTMNSRRLTLPSHPR